MAKQKGMSFVEKAGLFFGVVGVIADFTALVSFTYGFANLNQFIPSHVSSDSATSFFRWFSGLMIIYAWFITSWYLTRRTFVLRYEKPRAYKNPLSSRSTRTIFGVGLFLVPTFIFWSVVNVSFPSPTLNTAPRNTLLQILTSTPTIEMPQLVETELVTAITSTPSENTQIPLTPAVTGTPDPSNTSVSTQESSALTETSTPITTITNTPSLNNVPVDIVGPDVFFFYTLGFPLIIGFLD